MIPADAPETTPGRGTSLGRYHQGYWRTPCCQARVITAACVRWLTSVAAARAAARTPTGPALMFTTATWSAFTAGMKSGEFDG
ncbi:MAG: DUF397 domain-containing protein [Pseudonocardiaceae bacterium]